MDEASRLLEELAALGVQVWTSGEELRFGPREKVTNELRERLRKAKPLLMTMLQVSVTPPEPLTPATLSVPPRQPLPCTRLGPATSEMVLSGGIPLPVHHCAFHARAVRGQTVPSVHGCDDCPDRQTPAVVPGVGAVRNLLFHLYPVRDGGLWKWHADMLRERMGLFNGKKILALALDERTEDAATVRAVFAPLFDDILEVRNDPAQREVLTFEPLFSRVVSTDPQEVTLYAQGKCVSRQANPITRRWTELLYELYCDHWEETQHLLQSHPVCGSFKKVGHGWAENFSAGDWHYSGSWAWYRNRDLFLSDWQRIDRFWGGIEPYLSLHFACEDAACLFFEGPCAQLNLYDNTIWHTIIEPAYVDWKESRSPAPAGLKVEIGGGQHPRGEGFIDVDRSTGVDLECDRLPFENDTVAEVYSSHTFEHVRNLHHLLHEIVRICKVGARVEIRVPHWLSPMALCHDHKQVIPPEQVEHWTKTALGYWWEGCTKRLRHVRTEQVPSGRFAEAKRLHVGWSDEQVMRFVPGAAHEVRFTMRVVPNA